MINCVQVCARKTCSSKQFLCHPKVHLTTGECILTTEERKADIFNQPPPPGLPAPPLPLQWPLSSAALQVGRGGTQMCFLRVLLKSASEERFWRTLLKSTSKRCFSRALCQSTFKARFSRALLKSVSKEHFSSVLLKSASQEHFSRALLMSAY